MAPKSSTCRCGAFVAGPPSGSLPKTSSTNEFPRPCSFGAMGGGILVCGMFSEGTQREGQGTIVAPAGARFGGSPGLGTCSKGSSEDFGRLTCGSESAAQKQLANEHKFDCMNKGSNPYVYTRPYDPKIDANISQRDTLHLWLAQVRFQRCRRCLSASHFWSRQPGNERYR